MQENHRSTDHFESIGMLLIGFSLYELIFKRVDGLAGAQSNQLRRWVETLLGHDLLSEVSRRVTSIGMIFIIVSSLFQLQWNERSFQQYAESGEEGLYRSYLRRRYMTYFIQAGVTTIAFSVYGFDNALCLGLGFLFIDVKYL